MRRVQRLLVAVLLLSLGSLPQAQPAPAAQLPGLQLLLQRRAAALATPEQEAHRQQLLRSAEQRLRAGDTDAAQQQLEAAAALSHAADTEMLLIQAQLQRGDYRRALAFASHTAGAHLKEPRALALYAWLLALGEQTGPAAALLDEGLQRRPADPLLAALRTQLDRLQADTPAETDPALAAVRPGPLPSGTQPPAEAAVLAGGLLLNEGRLALVPLPAARATARLWVRNGRGTLSPARLEQVLDAEGLALLRLEQPLAPPLLRRAPRDAFAGSAASVIAHPADPAGRPAWPAMHSGFLGRVDQQGRQALGIALPQGALSGPVFDLAGRWIGMALGSEAAPRLLPLSRLAEVLGTRLQDLPTQASAVPLGPDQRYEEALPATLQLLGAD